MWLEEQWIIAEEETGEDSKQQHLGDKRDNSKK